MIGIAAGFTGILESFDNPASNGVELAVAEINEAGGVLGRQIELVTADTQSDVNQGSRAGQEVIQAGAEIMFVTPDFNFGGGAAREAQAAGMVAISMGAGSPRFGVEGIGDLAFTMGISGVTDGAVSAEWGYEDKGFRTAYLLLDDVTDYDKDQCRGFETRWLELGGEILGTDVFKNSDTSIAPQVTRINNLATQPDIISLCSFPPGGAVAVKQLRDAGITSAIVSNGAMDGDFWFKDTIPDLSDFYFLSSASIWGNDPSDDVNAFTTAYTEANGNPPENIFAFFGYAGMKAIAIAVERAGGTDGAAVAAELEAFTQEPVAGILVTFTDDLHIDIAREERIVSVMNGVHAVDAVRAVESSPPLFEE
ncbi:MAG: ABC transporter substrate-binding protein [Acidimicrobiia bacterium]